MPCDKYRALLKKNLPQGWKFEHDLSSTHAVKYKSNFIAKGLDRRRRYDRESND